jgi:predicted transcriptional regulator
MKVLLAMKPQYAEKIFRGEKKYEFRRTIFKNKAVKKVIVYASSPVRKVIGEFEIGNILTDNIDALWQQTKEHSGISEELFFQYFTDKSTGHAIQIKNVKRYRKPLCIRTDFAVAPPQSFLYL